MFFKLARYLRHGRLRRFSPAWLLLGDAYRWMYQALNLSKSVEHHIGPFGPFKLDAYFAFSNFENWGAGHNNGFEACIERCRSSRCFIDIGAHIGLVTIPAAKVMEGHGEVHAFEPSQANLKFLNQHIEANSSFNVTVNETLVGDRNCSVEFFESDYPNGQNSMVETSNVKRFQRCKRQQITLDDYVFRNGLVPDTIKIDVEGAEAAVLFGSQETLRSCKPIIYLSIHPAELAATAQGLDGLLELIHDCGYRCFEFNGTEAVQFRLAEYKLQYVAS